MNDEDYNAMKKARADAKRALGSISALLEHNLQGHLWDRADASRSCLEFMITLLNVEIDDYEWKKRQEERYKREHSAKSV
jgi:hypothetical protein